MGPIERFQRWMARGAAKAAGPAPVIFPEWMRYPFTTPTFRALATEGYKGNGAVFGCISALAFAFPEPPLLVWQETDGGDVPLKTHPLSKLLKRPNPQMGLAELLQYTIVYLAVGGNCYWYKVRSRAGRVVQLWPLHDGQMSPIAGKTQLIDHYELDTGQGQTQAFDVADVVHFKWMPDPMAPHKGLAPILAVAREVDTDNEATRYLFALLKNDAMPRLALVVPPGTELTDAQYRRLKTQQSDEHGGEKRGGVMVLEGGLDVKTIAINLRELEFNVMRRVPEARMAAAFRVPPIVAGLNVGLEQATYSNYAEAVLQFTERTLIPLWSNVADEVETDLLPDFGGLDDQEVEFDLDDVIALQTRINEKRTFMLDGFKVGGFTRNEFRGAANMPLDANGDVYVVPLSLVEVPATIRSAAGAKMRLSPKTALSLAQTKAKRTTQEQIITMQRVDRRLVGNRMETDLERYFADLGDRVVSRAKQKSVVSSQSSVKALPEAGDLLTPEDNAELGDILKRFTIDLVNLSWGTWNAALGVEVAFDLADPAVTELLAESGTRIKQISDTTLQAVRDLLQYGSDNGWSIDHLVRGGDGQPGLRDIVAQTYQGRARTIARTELGNAQNRAAHSRFSSAGVTKVYVLDDGIGDEDEPCIEVNQTVKPIEWMNANPLEHPNCTRAFAPEFD